MEKGLGRMNKVNLRQRRGVIFKTLPWETRIAFPTKIIREVVMLLRCLGVVVGGSNTWVGVLPSRMVAFDVIIGVIR